MLSTAVHTCTSSLQSASWAQTSSHFSSLPDCASVIHDSPANPFFFVHRWPCQTLFSDSHGNNGACHCQFVFGSRGFMRVHHFSWQDKDFVVVTFFFSRRRFCGWLFLLLVVVPSLTPAAHWWTSSFHHILHDLSYLKHSACIFVLIIPVFKSMGTGENRCVACVWIKMQEFRFYFWQVDVFPAFKPPNSKITLMAESRKCEGSQSKCGGKSKQSVRHEGETRRNNTVTATLSTNTLCVSLESLECTITPWVCFYIRAGVILRKTEAGHGKGRNWEQTLCLSRLSC